MLASLGELYKRVKESHDKQLATVLSVLRRKAQTDPEIAKIVPIVEAWEMKPPYPVQEIQSPPSETKPDLL